MGILSRVLIFFGTVLKIIFFGICFIFMALVIYTYVPMGSLAVTNFLLFVVVLAQSATCKHLSGQTVLLQEQITLLSALAAHFKVDGLATGSARIARTQSNTADPAIGVEKAEVSGQQTRLTPDTQAFRNISGMECLDGTEERPFTSPKVDFKAKTVTSDEFNTFDRMKLIGIILLILFIYSLYGNFFESASGFFKGLFGVFNRF